MFSLYIIYLGCILACFIAGLRNIRQLDIPSRIMCVIVGITMISETAAFIVARLHRNNLAIYAVFNILQMAGLCLYYNYAIDLFTRFYLGVMAAIASVFLGIFIVVAVEPVGVFNSTFLMIESITIILFSLYGFNRLLKGNYAVPISKLPHFWLMLTWCTYWAITATIWSVYGYMSTAYPGFTSLLNLMILLTAMLTYVAITILFCSFPKMNRSNDRA